MSAIYIYYVYRDVFVAIVIRGKEAVNLRVGAMEGVGVKGLGGLREEREKKLCIIIY